MSESGTVETPVASETPVAAPETPKAKKTVKKPVKAAKPAKAPAKPSKAKAKATPEKKETRTFTEVMKSLDGKGRLRKGHVRILDTLAKDGGEMTLKGIAKKSKLGERAVHPATFFLSEQGFAKVAVKEEGTFFKISSTGTSALKKAVAEREATAKPKADQGVKS